MVSEGLRDNRRKITSVVLKKSETNPLIHKPAFRFMVCALAHTSTHMQLFLVLPVRFAELFWYYSGLIWQFRQKFPKGAKLSLLAEVDVRAAFGGELVPVSLVIGQGETKN